MGAMLTLFALSMLNAKKRRHGTLLSIVLMRPAISSVAGYWSTFQNPVSKPRLLSETAFVIALTASRALDDRQDAYPTVATVVLWVQHARA